MIIDLDRAVAKYKLPLRVALHVGAHHGEEDDAYRRLGIEPIYVEANPAAFGVLRETLPDRECHNVAIADYSGEIDFHVTSFDQSSSILHLKKHKKLYPHIVERETIRVPCTTIDELLGSRCDAVDLINMDIQGAEFRALRGAAATLPHVQCVLTEVNRAELYEGCGLIEDLDRLLKGHDLHRVVSDFKFHRSWGDALYVRSRYRPARPWVELIRRVIRRRPAGALRL